MRSSKLSTTVTLPNYKSTVLLFYYIIENTNMPVDTAPTADQEEVEKFKGISTEWWDENGRVKLLHTRSKVLTPLIQESLINSGLTKKKFINTSTPLKDMNILEVGCGGGILTELLAKTGANVVGLDIVPELIKVAKQHASLDSSITKLTYLLEPVEDHSLQNSEKYDAVIASDVVEHVNEQEIFLKSCAKCLKPGGYILIATLNKTTTSWLGAIILAENILGIIPPGAHDWNKFISPEEVGRILEKSKCKTQEVRGICINLFKSTWFWIKSASVFYVLQAVKESSMN